MRLSARRLALPLLLSFLSSSAAAAALAPSPSSYLTASPAAVSAFGHLPAASARRRVLGRAPAPSMMFSGIVEEMGSVRNLQKVERLEQWDGSVGEGWELEVEASEALGQAYLGCSIAVNGVCLTVTRFDDSAFTVGLAPETLRKTNLQALSPGDRVNL
jgi:hypothetical protein